MTLQEVRELVELMVEKKVRCLELPNTIHLELADEAWRPAGVDANGIRELTPHEKQQMDEQTLFWSTTIGSGSEPKS